jgi:dihydroorotase
MYTAQPALELYAKAFDAAGRARQLEGFASHSGADFYGLPRNKGTMSLERSTGPCPRAIRSATRPWCLCGRARRFAGACHVCTTA